MAAPKGNKYYMKREKDGRELIYDSPEKFLTAAYAYFKWCDDNPWHKREAIKSGARTGEIIEIPVSRPYTLEGLCVHMGFSLKTFHNYGNRETFAQAVTHIRETIKQNQIEGAIIGSYNANIISRMLGMTENKSEAETATNDLVIESDDAATKVNLAIVKERLAK